MKAAARAVLLIFWLSLIHTLSGCNTRQIIAHTDGSQPESERSSQDNHTLYPSRILDSPTVSPYDIEEFINSQRRDEDHFIDFRPIWERLQISKEQDEAFDGFAPSSTHWRAEVISFTSSSVDSNRTILYIELFGGAYRRYLFFDQDGEWKCISHIDVLDCYEGSENSHRIVSNGKQVFLVLRAHPRIGTGVWAIKETWYRIDGDHTQEVLRYHVAGGRVGGYICDLEYKARIADPVMINDNLVQQVRYTVSFGAAYRPFRWLFSKKGKVYFVWDELADRFIVDAWRSDFSEEELENNFGGSNENEFIRYNFQRLVKLARRANPEQREWFNRVVSKLPEGTEKTSLQQALQY